MYNIKHKDAEATLISAIDFQLLFEYSPGLIVVLDPDFNIVAVSNAYLRATMTEREDILGCGIFDVFPDNPDDPNATGGRHLRASLNRVLKKRTSDTMVMLKYDIRRPASQGGRFEERYWTPVSSPVLDSDGEVKYIIIIVEDVTEFVRLKQVDIEKDKLTEELRKRAVKMEAEVYARSQEVASVNLKLKEANEKLTDLYERLRVFDQLKTQFFANVSHELRTPLALILGPVRKRLACPGLMVEEKRDLDIIERNAGLLLKHVNTLLDLSKLEAKKMSLEYAEADLSHLARLAASHFEVLADERGIHYCIDAPACLPIQVDPDKIQRVILNLLSNAFKFTPVHGKIRLGLRQRGEHAVCEVCDSGTGVAPELREVIFERFRQVEGNANRRYGGTGLGLAIVKEFVSLHGGAVYVDEAPEGGARFVVELPLSASSDSDIRPLDNRADSAESGRQIRDELYSYQRPPEVCQRLTSSIQVPLILVVEDNPDMSSFLVETLGKHYRVAVAFDGEEGLEKALALQPDLIVSDMMMPHLSGDQMISTLRRYRGFAELPVVMLTAKADDELQVKMLKESVQDYLTKPFFAEDLLARVERLLTERRRANDRSRLVVEAAPNAMIMVDQAGVITLVNAQTENLFGYSRKELIGEPIGMLIPERYRDVHQGYREKFFPAPSFKPMGKGRDLYGRRKNGTQVPIEIGLNPIEMAEGLFVLTTVVDITERKQMEQKLSAMNEELERQVKERTALAEKRAAKVRELASILTLAEQRERRRLAEMLHDHLQQLLVAAKIGISRLSQKITDPLVKANVTEVGELLEESVSTSRSLTVELCPPVLRDAGLAPALDWLARWMKEKHGLEIFTHVEPGLSKTSEDRKIILFQAVRELFFNIFKHAETHRATVCMRQEGNELCIAVEDRGKGFDPNILARASSTHFGLFNIRERLELLGCRMEIKSAPGKGTLCRLYAPVEVAFSRAAPDCKRASTATEKPDSFTAPNMNIRTLVVDDHKILRQCLICTLRDCSDVEIVGEAANGEEAVEKALALEPDIIIMDISMPGMTGMEATHKIKSIRPDIKIIGLSLHEAEDMALPMMQAGANAYHCKSGPVDDLIRSMRDIYGS